jgi:MFS family permease
MDTLGAAIGPALALVFLYFYPGYYKTLFLIAFVPGVFAIAATFLLKEKQQTRSSAFKPYSFLSFISYWKNSSQEYRKLAGALLMFALVNSSDVFLLLQMKAAGISDTVLIGIYIFYNLIYALVAYPVGAIADKIGLKKMFLIGLIFFTIAYGGIAFAEGLGTFVVIFFFYALYAAATEGIAKAWISNIADKKDTATAIGTFSGFQSIAALLASTVAGIVWYSAGATVLFLSAASVALLTGIYILLKVKEPRAVN